MRVLRQLLRPHVLIPLILGLAVMGYLVIGFGNIQMIWRLALHMPSQSLLAFFALMLGYEVIRGIQWHVLLKALNLKVDLRRQIFSFVGGEVTKSLPVGNFFQNYLLARTDGADFGYSSSATTLIIFLEVAVAIICVAILGIDGWPWLRWLALAGGVLALLILSVLLRLDLPQATPQWIKRSRPLRIILTEVRQFIKGARGLLRPRVLLVSGALGAAYLLDAAVGLYVLGHAVGLTTLTLGQAIAVYMFSLAMGLLVPVPIDLGITELSGVGALLILGMDRSRAITVLLANRVLSLGAAMIIAIIVMAVLRREFHLALSDAEPVALPPSDGLRLAQPRELPAERLVQQHKVEADNQRRTGSR